MEIVDLTVHELAEKLEAKELTSEEVTKAYFDRIKEVDPKVRAYISTLEDEPLPLIPDIEFSSSSGDSQLRPWESY